MSNEKWYVPMVLCSGDDSKTPRHVGWDEVWKEFRDKEGGVGGHVEDGEGTMAT